MLENGNLQFCPYFNMDQDSLLLQRRVTAHFTLHHKLIFLLLTFMYNILKSHFFLLF